MYDYKTERFTRFSLNLFEMFQVEELQVQRNELIEAVTKGQLPRRGLHDSIKSR